MTRPHAFTSSAYVQFPTLFHYFPLWLPSKTFSCVTIPYGDIPSSAICYFFLSLTHPLPSTLLLIPLPFWTSFGVLVLEDEGKHCYKLWMKVPLLFFIWTWWNWTLWEDAVHQLLDNEIDVSLHVYCFNRFLKGIWWNMCP